MGGRGGKLNTGSRSNESTTSIPVAVTRNSINVPEDVTKQQSQTLDRIFKFMGDNSYYTTKNMEFTEFEVASMRDRENEALGMRRNKDLRVTFEMERKDRADSSYLNYLDSFTGHFYIGPNGGMYTIEGGKRGGKFRKETLSMLNMASKFFWEKHFGLGRRKK